MEYFKKIWNNRVSEFPNRRILLNNETQEETVVTVSRDEGLVRQPGNQFSAEEMNDLENRVEAGLTSVEKDIPIRRLNYTLNVNGWQAYAESGQTFYRHIMTGLGVTASDRVDISAGIYYVDKIYSSLVPVNINGEVYVTTAIKPAINIIVDVYITKTRAG